MANIDIQRSGTRLWPWILGLVIIAALIVFFAATRDRDRGPGYGAGPDDTQQVQPDGTIEQQDDGLLRDDRHDETFQEYDDRPVPAPGTQQFDDYREQPVAPPAQPTQPPAEQRPGEGADDWNNPNRMDDDEAWEDDEFDGQGGGPNDTMDDDEQWDEQDYDPYEGAPAGEPQEHDDEAWDEQQDDEFGGGPESLPRDDEDYLDDTDAQRDEEERAMPRQLEQHDQEDWDSAEHEEPYGGIPETAWPAQVPYHQVPAAQPHQDQVMLPDQRTELQEDEMPGEVRDFVNFVRERDAEERMDVDHQYTSTGIEHLSSALGAVAEQHGVDEDRIRSQREQMNQQAEQLRQDPTSENHARMTRQAFNEATSAIETLAAEQPAAREEADQVRQAAQALDPDGLLLEQSEQVERFFEASSQAVQSLSTRPSPRN